MQEKRPKRPRDPNQLGKLIVALSVGEETETLLPDGKNAAAVALGRSGGKARAAALSSKKLSEIAAKAAKARWKKKPFNSILKSLGKDENDNKAKLSLAGSLASYVRDGKVFSKPAPNTFGLLEKQYFDDLDEGDDVTNDPFA